MPRARPRVRRSDMTTFTAPIPGSAATSRRVQSRLKPLKPRVYPRRTYPGANASRRPFSNNVQMFADRGRGVVDAGGHDPREGGRDVVRRADGPPDRALAAGVHQRREDLPRIVLGELRRP